MLPQKLPPADVGLNVLETIPQPSCFPRATCHHLQIRPARTNWHAVDQERCPLGRICYLYLRSRGDNQRALLVCTRTTNSSSRLTACTMSSSEGASCSSNIIRRACMLSSLPSQPQTNVTTLRGTSFPWWFITMLRDILDKSGAHGGW